jgi:hypothetical protein
MTDQDGERWSVPLLDGELSVTLERSSPRWGAFCIGVFLITWSESWVDTF